MTTPIAELSLGSLNGTNGFTVTGLGPSHYSGSSVSSAGDVNGDGIDDLIIGTPGVDRDRGGNDGATYVIFGDNIGFAATFDLADLDGTNGFALIGVSMDDVSGTSVSSAGDVNRDGIDDLIIGAPRADPDWNETTGESFKNAGKSYVVFGRESGFGASFDLGSLDGTNGFTLNGVKAGDNSGYSVSSAGDVNADGIDDLIIGAYAADRDEISSVGESYVVFGKASHFPATFDLADLNGANGFTLTGVDLQDYSGGSVSSAGDVNGDGIDDLIIGANGADPNGTSSAGESYVVFGSDTGFATRVDLADLNGTNGFTLTGIDTGDNSGASVSSAGDVNGDGIDDLIIGAFGADPNLYQNAGESYVVFGSDTGFAATFDLANLDGTNGFTLTGIKTEDGSGIDVSSAGDVNGDGIDDLIIGAYLADTDGLRNNAGESYVVFGRDTGFAATFDLGGLDGTNGVTLTGVANGGQSGSALSSAGDVNGDGIDDLIIGAPYVTTDGIRDTGASYVVFGGQFPASQTGTSNAITLTGTDGDDTLTGGLGDDSLYGRQGDDRLIGGAGADILNGNRGFDFADYSDSSAGVTVDLRTGTGTGGDAEGDTLSNIEGIEGSADADTLLGYTVDEILTGLDGGDILRGKGGNDTLFGGNGADRVNGGAGNDTLFGEFGADILQGRGGDDVLWGGSGQDILKGHAGDDRLNGEDGDDHIEGKGGNDTLTGGTGADIFVFEKNRFGNDVITDFEDDIDTIELVESLWGGGQTAAQVLATYATQDGTDVDLDFGTATLTVQNTTVAVLENDLSFV